MKKIVIIIIVVISQIANGQWEQYGNGIEADIRVDYIDFGNVKSGDTVVKNMVIHNFGMLAGRIYKISINSSKFILINSSYPTVLDPWKVYAEDSLIKLVKFDSRQTGSLIDTVVFYCGYEKVQIRTSIFKAQLIESINEIPKIQNDLTISPNPATDFIEITVRAEQAMPLQIWIYDVFGREVNLTQSQDYPTPALPGGEGVKIDVSTLSAGLYFVRFGGRVGKFLKI